MPPGLFFSAWFFLAAGYSARAIHTLSAIRWADGGAMTYLSLVLEVCFLPAALFHRSRGWMWLAMVGMHIAILSLVGFSDLTLGVLMMHLFAFDARWLSPIQMPRTPPVLLFDGVCGLCNSAVDFAMAEDTEGRLRFAPLQGEYAERVVGDAAKSLRSLVLVDNGQVLEKSDAVLRVAQHLGGMWRLAAVARVVPRPLRDLVYDFVATHRYRWFGKKETCRMPTAEERARFIA